MTNLNTAPVPHARVGYDNSKSGIAASIGTGSTRIGWALLDLADALREIAKVGHDYVEVVKGLQTRAAGAGELNRERASTRP